jgi:hypothetical protein
MKRIFIKVGIALAMLGCQSSFADDKGLLFNVASIGTSLAINTTIPHHTYPAAGIKINTPGYTLAGAGTECTPIGNGYCLFPVSDTQTKNISIAGSAGNLNITLCLNGSGPLSCQNYDNLTVQSIAKFAYVANFSNPSVAVCTLNQSNGVVESCQDAGGDSVLNGIDAQGIVLNKTGTYAYITAESGNSVYQCAIDQATRLFTSCSATTITSPAGYSPLYGMITLNPANTIAYVVDYHGSPSRVLACPLVGNIISGTCIDTGATLNAESAQITVNNTGTVAYIANYVSGGVEVCNINAAGTVFSGCIDKTGGSGISFNEVGGVALNADQTIIYVSDYGAGKIYGCSTTSNGGGTFNSCFLARTAPSQSWGITVNELNTVAYYADYDASLYACPILANGTFPICSINTTLSGPVDVTLAY